MTKICPESEWEWYGTAGHLCVGRYCRFHLATKVGKFWVSTVGEYLPPEGTREVLAESRGVKLAGMGDAREADYMNKIGYETLGVGDDSIYETMVFHAGQRCESPDCNCGMPVPEDWSNLDGRRWATAREAREGHMFFCHLYATKQLIEHMENADA